MVIGCKGGVLWSADGDFTDAKGAELSSALKEAKGEGKQP